MVKQEKSTKNAVQSAKKKTVSKNAKTPKIEKKTTQKKNAKVQDKNIVVEKEKKKISKLELILLLIILLLLLLLFMFVGYPWLGKQLGWINEKTTEQTEKKDQKESKNKLSSDDKDDEDDKYLETGTTDENGDQTSNNQGSTTVKYIYGEGSSSTSGGNGNQGGSGSGNQNTSGGSITKPEQPVVPIATFRLSDGEANTVSLNQASRSTNVVFRGKLAARPPMPSNGINTGYYVQFMVIAPKAYSQDTLANMSVSTLSAHYGKLVDGYIDGKPYFYMTQEFIHGTKSKLTINWGDGYEVTYALTFLVETN